MGDWQEDVIRYKYDPIPEEPPRHRKKSRKRHVRSDHKHAYEDVCIDAHSFIYRHGERLPYYYVGTRCKVCGRLQDVTSRHEISEPPEGMPLYEVADFMALFEMRVLPTDMRIR